MPERPQHRIHFRQWREARGMTQREVATALGVGQNTVAYWDTGRQPKVEYLPEIAKLFGCSIDALYGPPKPVGE